MRLPRILLLATLLTPLSVHAATLKPYSRIAGNTVRLSDLWDGVKHDVDLGPAPAPGGRITVPAAQLSAIAHQFDVDWQPNSSDDRAIVDRSGRALTRDDLLKPLRAALSASGAPGDGEIELSAFTAPQFPEGRLEVSVAQTEFDKTSGRFAASVDIAAPDASPTRIRVTGRVQEMTDLPILRRRLLPGDVVTSADLGWTHLPRASALSDIVQNPADAIGLSARRAIAPDQPIHAADLGEPILVQKGNDMIVTLDIPGLSVTARGTALDSGGRGQRIRILNEYTRTVVDAVILAPNRARVVPGSARPANRSVAYR